MTHLSHVENVRWAAADMCSHGLRCRRHGSLGWHALIIMHTFPASTLQLLLQRCPRSKKGHATHSQHPLRFGNRITAHFCQTVARCSKTLLASGDMPAVSHWQECLVDDVLGVSEPIKQDLLDVRARHSNRLSRFCLGMDHQSMPQRNVQVVDKEMKGWMSWTNALPAQTVLDMNTSTHAWVPKLIPLIQAVRKRFMSA